MLTIPRFPDSVDLSIRHKNILQPFLLKHRHHISEYSMASLLPFTKKREYTVSSYIDQAGEEAFLFIGKDRSGDQETLFAMIPAGYPGKEIIKQLRGTVTEINTIAGQLEGIWKQQLKSDGFHFKLEEDRDNADYLYDRKSLIDLSGQVLHKKMAHVNRFIKEHPERIIIPTHIAPASDMISVLDQWAEGKDVVEDYLATRLAIENHELLSLSGYVLYSKDTPIAFTLGEFTSNDTFIVHIEKALTTYKGVYQYINRACVSLLPENITTVNREQDLGIPGLRQAKMTYQPKDLLMKYRIRVD